MKDQRIESLPHKYCAVLITVLYCRNNVNVLIIMDPITSYSLRGLGPEYVLRLPVLRLTGFLCHS